MIKETVTLALRLMLSACFCPLLIASLFLPAADAQNVLLEGNKYVKAQLVFDHESLEPQASGTEGRTRIGILFDIQPGWHIYWQNSGESGKPTSVSWSLPPGWSVNELEWPLPVRYVERGDITTYAYSEQVLLHATLNSPVEVPTNSEILSFEASLSWLVCSDRCVPGRTSVSAEIEYSSELPATPSVQYSDFEEHVALTPSPSSAFRHGKMEYEILQSHNAISAKDRGRIAFLINGLFLPTASPNELFQIFPLKSEFIQFGAPAYQVVPGTDYKVLLTLPYRVLSGAPLGEIPVSGVIAASALGLSRDQDSGATWSTNIEISASSQLAPEFAKIFGESKEIPLQGFRFEQVEGEKTQISATLPEVAKSQPKSPGFSWGALAFALISAFIGGLLLNLMPCVLPIISIKVMGFVGLADKSKQETRREAFFFCFGILSTFLVLAGIVVLLRSLGVSFGWGFQFQYPAFVLALTLIVFILSLGFFDVYTISLPYLQQANKAASKLQGRDAKNFFDGVLATALSTPCTAPFLGSALVFAFSQHPLVTFLIFPAVGLGLALPYAYLATHPKLIDKLPKPGPWMQRFRQLMGFFLLATVIWLLFVLDRLTVAGDVWCLLLMLVVYFSFWLHSSVAESKGRQAARKALVFGVAISCLTFYLLSPLLLTPRTSGGQGESLATARIEWKPWNKDAVSNAVAAGQAIFIDFTADWCITCKFNENTVIETDSVAKLLKDKNFATFKADWTSGDPAITEALKSYGGEGVPLYVVIGKGGTAVLPTILTQSILLDALNDAAGE